MKIGILTHCLGYNYGGLLQNYALQQVLIKLGHEPITLNHQPKSLSYKRKFLSLCKRALGKIKGSDLPLFGYPTKVQLDYINKNLDEFKNRCIFKTEQFSLKEMREKINVFPFHAIIVGSDQVWRYKMMKNEILEMFLSSFQNKNIKKISYAASFGTDFWEMPQDVTDVAKCLVRKFDKISVREQSAIRLCKEQLGVDACVVLDPTLLLSSDEYIQVVKSGPFNIEDRPNSLLTYILDQDIYKKELIDSIISQTGLIKNEIYPRSKFAKVGRKKIEDCVYPSVEEWLKGFLDAEMVITDSFHGTVFSIIFNKPIWVIGNEVRGMARFQSLLSMFDLNNRLIENYPTDIREPIDWYEVNDKLENMKKKSINFLKDNLL